MSDLVERLRRWHDIAKKYPNGCVPMDYVIIRQAFEEIATYQEKVNDLEKELERLNKNYACTRSNYE